MWNLYDYPVEDNEAVGIHTKHTLFKYLSTGISSPRFQGNVSSYRYYIPIIGKVVGFESLLLNASTGIGFEVSDYLLSNREWLISRYWYPSREWLRSFKEKGGAPDHVTHTDDSYLIYCVPNATFLINTYWWSDRNTIAWYWGLRLMSDDNFQAHQDGILFPPDVQYGRLPPFVLSNLTG